MKFFTRAWANGEMTDDQFEAVREAYWQYVATLQLPPMIAALSKLNTHDAYVLGVDYQPERSHLTLRLRCGDRQRGYSDVILTFSQVTVDPAALDTLRRSLRPAAVEVLYDEVDRSRKSFDYRLLLHPDGEVNIQFEQVDITERRVADRQAV
jgi:hypothetical protein